MNIIQQIHIILLYSIGIVSCLKVCSRRHSTIYHDAIFQRVELSAAVKCIERCIESIAYCKAVVFVKYSKKDLGICIVHTINSHENSTVVHPDASIDPESTVYELLEKCPLYAISDMAHRISPNHKRLLDSGGQDNELLQQDAFFPENDRFSDSEIKIGKRDRYATMKSIDMEENVHNNPFEIPQNRNNERPKSPFTDMRPITPVQVLHQGRQMNLEVRDCGGMPCVPTLASLDTAPCPARRGDPCAPKPPCIRDACYHIDAVPETVHVEWSEWTGCSITCGPGVRTRKCLGGVGCVGSASMPCTLPPCSEWMLWGAWSFCSASCGVGEKKRTRLCTGVGGCIGASAMVESCQMAPCPSWSEWSSWQGCNIPCGRGKERRMRTCQNGIFCNGSPFEDRECDKGPCPHWSDWTPWTTCSRSCDGGDMSRSRECINGATCVGSSEEKLLCNQQRCPDWTAWTEWSMCDQTKCDDETFRLRNRVCLYRGVPYAGCEGAAQDQLPCPTKECATWSEWKEWSECSATCGQGNQMRARTCEGGNGHCEGASSELRFCQLASCPYWGPWTDWGGCSVSCGLGVCERRRKCITDELLNIPSDLEELDQMPMESEEESNRAKQALIARSKHIKMKHMNSSHIMYADIRYAPFSGGLNLENAGTCIGNDVDRKTCDAGPCCMWETWTEWSPCIGCGSNGISRRNRQCMSENGDIQRNPQLSFQEDTSNSRYTFNGRSDVQSLSGLTPIVPIIHRGKRSSDNNQCYCPGSSLETRPCPSAIACVEDAPTCQWSSWGEWCGCTPCRVGREVRRRYCDRVSSRTSGPKIPDPNCRCPGSEEEHRQCKSDESCYNREFPTLSAGEGEAEAESSQNIDHYIPIESRINNIEIAGRNSPPRYPLNRKDSAFSTTAFPYPVCRWSQWAEWSKCNNSGRKERNRFCINSDALVNNCECMGMSTDTTNCDPDEDDLPARGNPVPGEEHPLHVETEFTTEEENELDSDLDSVLKSSEEAEAVDERPTNTHNEAIIPVDPQRPKQPFDEPQPAKETPCEWTRWSQWSECTTSCGPGEKLRKRRCPCGDGECGGGIETEMEACQRAPCSADKRRHPVFTMHSI